MEGSHKGPRLTAVGDCFVLKKTIKHNSLVYLFVERGNRGRP
jgi:hypothetical protein